MPFEYGFPRLMGKIHGFVKSVDDLETRTAKRAGDVLPQSRQHNKMQYVYFLYVYIFYSIKLKIFMAFVSFFVSVVTVIVLCSIPYRSYIISLPLRFRVRFVFLFFFFFCNTPIYRHVYYFIFFSALKIDTI